eukprot:3261478-Amphidinium_carterae.1
MPKAKRKKIAATEELAWKRRRTEDAAAMTFLTFVSPVFRRMLDCGMAEAQTKEINLPGKKKEEFEVFMNAIEPLSPMKLTEENAHFLARWADEYGVEGLKERCEKELLLRPVT